MLEIARLLTIYDADTRGFDEKSKDVEGTLEKLSSGSVFGGFVGAQIFMEAGRALAGLAMEGVQAYASFERLGMSLETLAAREALNTGQAQNMSAALAMSGEKAEGLVRWIQELAVKSPFSQEGVSAAFRQAMAYGFASDEAQRLTQALIDFAAGSGAGEGAMNQIALALGQIQAKGKLSGQEILQLVNAGIPVQQILAKAFGKSTAEIAKMTEQGLIPANAAIEAIVQSLEQDFSGAAARQAESVSGLLTSLSDLKDINLTAFFGGFFEEVQPYLAEFVDALSDPAMQKNLADLGKSAGELVGSLVEGGREIFNIWESMPDWMQNVTVALVGIEAMTPSLIDGLGHAAVTLNNFGGTLKSIPGFLRDVNAAQALLKEGAGVFNVMSTGAAGVTAALGPLAVALAAVTAVAVTYHETIVKAQKEGLAENVNAWARAMQDAAENGKTTAAILDEYAAAIQRVNTAHEDGGLIADLFVNKQEIIRNGLTATIDALGVTAGSWEEYQRATQEAAKMAGYQVDEQGRLFTLVRTGAGITKKYADDLGILTETQFLLNQSYREGTPAITEWWQRGQEISAGLPPLNNNAVSTAEILSNLNAVLTAENVSGADQIYREVAFSLGVIPTAAQQAATDVKLLNEAFALGLMPQTEYVTYMQQAAQGTLNLGIETRNSIQGMIDNANATREAASAAADAAQNYWGLAESLKGASEAQFAKQMLGQLGELLKSDTPNVALYNQAYKDLALSYGFASEGSMALAGALPKLFEILQQGKIAPEQMSEAMGYLYQDAQDGAVNWEAFAQKFNITEPFGITQTALEETGAAVMTFGEDATKTTSVIETEFPKWVQSAQNTAESISKAFTGENWAGVGLAISEGVAAGILQGVGNVADAARQAAKAAYSAATDELGIHSPSTKFKYLGEMAVKGFEMPFIENNYQPVRQSLAGSATVPVSPPATQYSGSGVVELADATIQAIARALAFEIAAAGVGQ